MKKEIKNISEIKAILEQINDWIYSAIDNSHSPINIEIENEKDTLNNIFNLIFNDYQDNEKIVLKCQIINVTEEEINE